jgi:alpha-D-ribose 1-methylphosphonate 5-triphosphate synthase subunit PhnL
MAEPAIIIENVSKSFVLHLMGGTRLDIVRDVSFAVPPASCTVLGGPSGAGKSSLIKMIYGNYRVDSGRICVRTGGGTVDIATAAPRTILRLRQRTIGYVSQFLRVIPRVSALDIVASHGLGEADVNRDRAVTLLRHLSVPERLWALPPATFSGGEQQRVNIACGFMAEKPVLLLDEPTASLDQRNREAVVELIEQRKAAGSAIIAIFHDQLLRDRLADDVIDVTRHAATAQSPDGD